MEVHYDTEKGNKTIKDVVQVRYNPRLQYYFIVTNEAQFTVRANAINYIDMTDYTPLMKDNLTLKEIRRNWKKDPCYCYKCDHYYSNFCNEKEHVVNDLDSCGNFERHIEESGENENG